MNEEEQVILISDEGKVLKNQEHFPGSQVLPCECQTRTRMSIFW